MQKTGDVALTFLLIEILEQMQEALDGMDSYQALQVACEWAGLVPPGEVLSEDQAESLLQRMVPKGVDQEVKSEDKPRSGKRTFATEFLKYYEKLSLQDKCLFAAGYDFEVARLLYCVYDKAVTEEIIKKQFDDEFARMQVGYEAVVFGMGGSFGSGSREPEGEVTDFAPSQGSGDYINAAQDFVNMQKSFRSKVR